MTYRDWLPSLWTEGGERSESPFHALQKRVDSLFEEFDRGVLSREGAFLVRSNVSETDTEICITAELPGMEEKDVQVSVTGNRITLKGEKKSEKDEKKEEEGRHFHRVERTSGSFERSMTMPFEIDAKAVKAEVKNGILTVTMTKPPEVQEKSKTKTIEVKAAS